MTLMMGPLQFVHVDQIPPEWMDGRALLAFGDWGNGHRDWREARDPFRDCFAVIWWESGWVGPTAIDKSDYYNLEEVQLDFTPTWLAELPANMEVCKGAE